MTAILLSAFLVAQEPPDESGVLTLRLEAPKKRVLAGEPTKLVLSWSTSAPFSIAEEAAVLLIDSGAGFQEYREARSRLSGTRNVVHVPHSLVPAEVRRSSLVVGVTSDPETERLVLPLSTPGPYRLKARYFSVYSNEVSLDVRAPSGSDDTVFSELKQQPQLLTEEPLLDPALGAQLRKLIEDHPESPHLARPRIGWWADQLAAALASDRGAAGDPIQGELGRLLGSIEATQLAGSPFDEDRLFLCAETRAELGDLEGARRLYAEILESYPSGVHAPQVAKWLREEGDSSPPSLAVAAAPSSLWPPDHKLVPVTIAVTVSDDTDASPEVKLVSITCNDACNPAEDIAGATLNTDDRDFALRAERMGGGPGRTYQITYSATDASRNTTTAQTTVTVPHDQRR